MTTMSPPHPSNPPTRRMAGATGAAVSALVALAALAPSTLVSSAHAYDRHERGYVVAESRWGHGTVSGPVRHARGGPQVRLPGGTWIYCERSCSETLRRQSVDFWESMGAQAKDSGPGYLSWSFGRRH